MGAGGDAGVDPPQPVERRRAADRRRRTAGSGARCRRPTPCRRRARCRTPRPARRACPPSSPPTGGPPPRSPRRPRQGRPSRTAGGGALGSSTGMDWVSKMPNRSRSDVRASAHPSTAPWRNGCRRARSKPGRRLGAERRRDPREADPAERGRDLDLGVGPRLEPPEQLEDEALVVDEGAVRLLRPDRSGPGRRLGPAGDPVEHHERQLRVEDGVVGGGRALAPVDDAQHRPVVAPQELGLLPLRPQADDELVGDPVGVHHQPHQLRPVAADDVLVDDRQRLRRLLAGVPALLRKVVPEDLDGDHWPWSGSTSSNQ